MSELKSITLAKVLNFSNGRSSPERDESHTNPVYGSNGVIGYSNETNAPAQTIVIGRVGSYCGSLYFSASKSWVTDNAIRANALDDNDPKFLFYLLQTLGLNHWRSGSGQPLLNQTILGGIPASIPEPSRQRAIAHILGTLDDKIELNRRMNETLEAMARAIFQSWFVDFAPVHAKASGEPAKSICSRLGLTPELLALFPDSFENPELGEIPKGWSMSTIGTLANVTGGSTPNTKEPKYWDDGIHYWATPKDLSRLSSPVLLGTERKVTDEGLSQIGSGLLEPGAVLLSSRAPIGYRAINEVPVAVNQGFIAMKPNPGVSKYFLLYWAEWAHDEIVSRANGSTFLEISKANFRPIPVVRPMDELFATFDQYIDPMYRRIVSNEQETQLLTEQRDSLLPELLSGKKIGCQ